MKAYPEYKSVSAEEKIIYPSHWQCVKPKFFVSLDKGRKPNDTSFDNTGLPPYLTMDVLRGRDTFVQYPFSSENLLEVHDNDTLILWDGANAGEVMVGKHGFLSSTMALVNFDSTKFNKFFILYLLKSKEPIFKLKASGTTIPHFDGKYFLDTPIAFPNYDEQTAIAEYLDEVTGKIDALVDEKQAQVDELRAYRTSLITETVTRGLNPDAPLRPSGINWLGDIPQHWEIIKSSYVFDNIGSGTTPTSGEDLYYEGGSVNWLQTGDLNDGVINSTSKKITPFAVESKNLKFYNKGSVVIAMYGATIAKLGLLNIQTTVNQACCVLTPSTNIYSKYAFYCFYSAKNELISLASGGGQPNISQATISDFKLPVPPLAEQQAIADFLDAKTAKIDELIGELTKQIDELTEYKQAVITEAVTGKVDVRDYKPSN